VRFEGVVEDIDVTRLFPGPLAQGDFDFHFRPGSLDSRDHAVLRVSGFHLGQKRINGLDRSAVDGEQDVPDREFGSRGGTVRNNLTDYWLRVSGLAGPGRI
jgi:hypothetical protein